MLKKGWFYLNTFFSSDPFSVLSLNNTLTLLRSSLHGLLSHLPPAYIPYMILKMGVILDFHTQVPSHLSSQLQERPLLMNVYLSN
ncbi:MAG: hypothetical protein P4L79_15140 [Legionella sp.]|uniref:hypothetical protein n=1 Tax=Legionella sp. TaxID=459 RepID=UPI0028471441|nr:hypothetical protein [Legionella sp.]